MRAQRQGAPERRIGRYEIFGELASGGMGAVHFGRIVGDAGFARVVAIKRLHPQYSREASFVEMFVDEARLAAQIHHPNVIATLDAVAEDGELLLVMEYVAGASLASLLRTYLPRGARVPPKIALRLASDVLYGLHAAHTATNEDGAPLQIVHRDVSPQNILVGSDGLARILDFGIAKAANRLHATTGDQIKGKLAYMAPEQLLDGEVGPQTDVYAASVVLWECLTGERLFAASNSGAMMAKVLEAPVLGPRSRVPEIDEGLDALVLRGLARDPAARFQTAREMANALETHGPVALASEVAEWVEEVAAGQLAERAERLATATATAVTRETPKPLRDPPVELAAPSPVASPPRAKWPLRLAVVVALLVGLAVAGARLMPRSTPIAAPSSSVAAVAPAASPAVSLPERASSSAPAPSAPAPASARAPATRLKPAKRSCDPPYIEDATGIRVVKPECL
ncbi:MAG: serine/threonine protein kinase [Labilithrix sp.]|nr:serine/threonine protein kinase [Labilithrix sp.]MCW5813203.1 serine/threonine protein kinase [Labilithrix sp.]